MNVSQVFQIVQIVQNCSKHHISPTMIVEYGKGLGRYIAASSTPNQRIERLWRDVWNCVCSQFYHSFQAMEAEG